ncbi:hypothetical protein [Nocardiopsis synnemataformans]|uniref:hypothetical protein n=1 Tax=Nocardiopsis synnemataformans TaxID=61305 RepID=UPI003EBF3054
MVNFNIPLPGSARQVTLIDSDTANNLAHAWGHSDLAAKVAPALTCTEADTFAEMLAQCGDTESAQVWILEHARSDEEGDRHYHLRDDSHPAPDPAEALSPTLRKALALFVTVWESGELAEELGPRLQCEEVKALATLLTAAGEPDSARVWEDFHAEQDDAGDSHYRGAADDVSLP